MRTALITACILMTTPACIPDSVDDNSLAAQGHVFGEIDRDTCKIEGSDIGVDGATVPVGRVLVTFDEWYAKDGAHNEFVGFRISVDGASQVSYTVKASTERFRSQGAEWRHPSGARAHAISHVDFCDQEPPANPDGPDGQDPSCNDPDGCDPGTGTGGDEPPTGTPDEPTSCAPDGSCPGGEFCDDGVCKPIIID